MTADIVSLDRARRLSSPAGVIEPNVAHWKCRTPTCMTKVGVGQTALEALAMFSEVLKERRERAIESHEVMLCPTCAERWHEREQLKSRGLL